MMSSSAMFRVVCVYVVSLALAMPSACLPTADPEVQPEGVGPGFWVPMAILCVLAGWAGAAHADKHAHERRAQAACADVASAAPCACGRGTAPVHMPVLDVAEALLPYPVELAAAPPAYAAK